MPELATPEISTLVRYPQTGPTGLPIEGLVLVERVRVDYVVPVVAIGYTFFPTDLEESCPCVKPTQLQPLIQMEEGLHG